MLTKKTQEVSCRLRVSLHDCVYTLAQVFVRQADHSGRADRRVQFKRRFNLGRIDVCTTAQDHVGFAVDEVQEPILIHPSDVTQRLPTVGQGLWLRTAIVISHAAGVRPHVHLADDACRDEVPVDDVTVDLEVDADNRADFGVDDVPPGYQRFRLSINVTSPADPAVVEAVVNKSLAISPLIALHREPQEMAVTVSVDGGAMAAEKAALDELDAPGIDRAAREQAFLILLDATDVASAQHRILERLRPDAARHQRVRRVAELFAWGILEGRRLTGRLLAIRMLGGGEYAYTRLEGATLHVSPLPLLRGVRHGETIVRG